jgi:hypothetical protein
MMECVWGWPEQYPEWTMFHPIDRVGVLLDKSTEEKAENERGDDPGQPGAIA